MRLGFFILTTVVSFYAYASASTTFVSLKSSEINLRVGPGKEYPISWTFLRARLPVMLIAEFNEWKKIKFIDETEGWVHQNMVSRKNTAIITSPYSILYKYASDAQPIAKIEKDVIVTIVKKDKDWIKVEVNKIKGWLKKQDLWGINED